MVHWGDGHTQCACVAQVLQGTDGYELFEKRRQNKFSKAIDGNAMIKQGGVDEGVDVAVM